MHDGVDVRLLGTFEVWDGQRQIALGAAQQRRLLAVLVLALNCVVPTDRLRELLWGGAPPDSAANMLQVYVGRLRRALGHGHAGMLLTRPPGYLLVADPDALDSRRFERLAESGKRALSNDPARAVEELHGALRLWRGPALAEFAELPVALAEAHRLEERRLSALEDVLEAELALGRHADVVASAEALVSEHPLREHLRGQLMVALYRGGRQADALRAFEELRLRLRDELGVDPNPAIRALERSILVHDPALARSGTIAGARRGVPRARAGSGASLLITTSRGRHVVALPDERFCVGRGAENDLVLEGDGSVSRRHVLLERRGATWFAQDLGSSNGTRVNGIMLGSEACPLTAGDEIRVGAATLVLAVTSEDMTTLKANPPSG